MEMCFLYDMKSSEQERTRGPAVQMLLGTSYPMLECLDLGTSSTCDSSFLLIHTLDLFQLACESMEFALLMVKHQADEQQ